MKQWQKYIAELLGTFTLVFLGSVAILGDAGIVGIAFGIALLAGLYAFGEVSGGHFNPIVSLAMFFDRRLSLRDLDRYWLAQFLGAILASLVVLLGFTSADRVSDTATFAPSDGRAFVLELFASAVFVAVILQVTKSRRYGATALAAIPLTLAAIHFALIPFSGSSVNPARSLAPTLVGASHWGDIWIYMIALSVGGIVAWIAQAVVVKGEMNVRDELARAAGEILTGRSPV